MNPPMRMLILLAVFGTAGSLLLAAESPPAARPAFAAARLPAKNSARIAPHSSARTPPVTSARWFSFGWRSTSITDPAAPAFGSVAP